MLTAKPREAVLTAYNAPGVTLHRCCGGFFDRSKGAQSPKVTVRTANGLVESGIGVYDDPYVPSTFTLTPEGIRTGRVEASAQ